MKKCIVTAVFSKSKKNFDLPYVKKKLSNIDYICYTNISYLNKIKNKIGWKILLRPLKYNCPIYSNRYYKWLTHKELSNKYDIMIYVDGFYSPNIKYNWEKIFNLYEKKKFNGIILKKHPTNNCIYKECVRAVKAKKIGLRKMAILYNYLKKNKMPKNRGLFENNLIIKSLKNNKLNKLLEILFNHMLKFSYRDQTLLTYILWKYKYKNLLYLEPNKKYLVQSGKSSKHKYI